MHFLQTLRSALTFSSALFVLATAAGRTSPPSGAVVVDKTGQHGGYTTVQAGINSLSTTQTGTQTLFIYPGSYKEQVVSVAR